MAIRKVYNLVFPSYRDDFDIGGYTFRRVPEYADRLKALHHTLTVHSEFSVKANTGTHAITAVVVLPRRQAGPVLPWGHKDATALDDILLILSLFTKRQVFAVKDDQQGNSVVVADPREFFFGGMLPASLPSRFVLTGTNSVSYDAGFEEGIQAIYDRIRAGEWKKRYHDGHFLLLFREACRRQILETSFVLCWTIWENLFSILNSRWMSDEAIRRLPSRDKLAYIVAEFAILREVRKSQRGRLGELVDVRNAIVHSGRFPSRKAEETAALFVRATELLIVKILGLRPSDPIGAMARFVDFVSNETRGVTRAG